MFSIWLILLGFITVVLPVCAQKPQADEKFGLYRYGEAIPLYKAYLQKQPDDAGALRNLARSCTKINDVAGAREAYRSLLKLDAAEPDDWFWFARILQIAGDTGEARKMAVAYQAKLPGEKADYLLQSINRQAEFLATENGYSVTNKTGSYDFSLFSPCLSGDRMIFTAETRAGDIDPWTGRGVTRLFTSDTSFNQLIPFATELMTGSGDGMAAFSPDRRILYFTSVNPRAAKERGADTRKLMIVAAVSDGQNWAPADLFPFNSRDFSSAHPALRDDGKMLVFSSDRPGGKGGMDLWYCIYEPGGNWGEPVNISMLNTSGHELFPVFNENHLYFSSEGWPGLGGLDLFRSAHAGAGFSEPENLKAPLNSPYDDFSLVTEDDLGSGWLSTNRFGNPQQDDIAWFRQRRENPVTADTVRGKDVPAESLVSAGLPLPVVGLTIRLENIYYDFDKCDIKPGSAEELDRLVKLMNDYPDMMIELSSHTDCRGSFAYNERLSQCRADAAVRYILGKGILRSRITAKGYGEYRLVNECADGVNCTEAQHQDNRRTEFTTLSCPSCPPQE